MANMCSGFPCFCRCWCWRCPASQNPPYSNSCHKKIQRSKNVAQFGQHMRELYLLKRGLFYKKKTSLMMKREKLIEDEHYELYYDKHSATRGCLFELGTSPRKPVNIELKHQVCTQTENKKKHALNLFYQANFVTMDETKEWASIPFIVCTDRLLRATASWSLLEYMQTNKTGIFN